MDILPEAPDPSTPQHGREYLCEDSDYQLEFPAIYEYLSRVQINGQVRVPSRLVTYYEDGQCVLLLTDPHCSKILFHASETIPEGLLELNERLAHPPVKGWKRDRRARSR